MIIDLVVETLKAFLSWTMSWLRSTPPDEGEAEVQHDAVPEEVPEVGRAVFQLDLSIIDQSVWCSPGITKAESRWHLSKDCARIGVGRTSPHTRTRVMCAHCRSTVERQLNAQVSKIIEKALHEQGEGRVLELD